MHLKYQDAAELPSCFQILTNGMDSRVQVNVHFEKLCALISAHPNFMPVSPPFEFTAAVKGLLPAKTYLLGVNPLQIARACQFNYDVCWCQQIFQSLKFLGVAPKDDDLGFLNGVLQ
jgi:hypothetical protein